MSTATMSRPKRKAAGLVPANRRNATAAINADTEPEIQILPPKLAAIEQLGECEDEISWEELIDCLKLREAIDQSAWEINNGLGRSHEEVKAEFYARWQKSFG